MVADNSDAKSIDSWGGGTYATMQSTLVPMAAHHGERVFTCPKHGGQYDDRNALCRECEQEFYEKRSALKEQQALVQQKLQELGTAEANANTHTNSSSLETQPPVAVGHPERRSSGMPEPQQTHAGDAAPPVATLQWTSRDDKMLMAQSAAAQTQPHSASVTVPTRNMYEAPPQPSASLYSPPAPPGHGPTMPMVHPPSPAGMMPPQGPFHAQQPTQTQHHTSNTQPSPTSHALPPRYPGMMGMPTGQPGPSPHHHMPQSHTHTTTPMPMAQPPPGPSPGSTPLGTSPTPFWSSPTGPPPPQTSTATAPLDALTLQIQRMQQMQDWIIWQKENENAQLKQQLEHAQSELNQLRLDNVLLTEKLHQQEQRMQQELKLIKMAALQSRQQRKNSMTTTSNSLEKQLALAPQHQSQAPPPPANMMPSPTQTTSWQGFDDPAFFQPDFMPSSSLQSSEDNAQQQSNRKQAAKGSSASNMSLQQPQLVDPPEDSIGTGNSMGETLSDEGKDEFDSNSITWPAANNSNAMVATGRLRASKTQKNAYKRKVGPLTTGLASPRRGNGADTMGQPFQPVANSQPEKAVAETATPANAATPVPGEAATSLSSSAHEAAVTPTGPRQVEGSHRIVDLDEYSLEAASIPQDIDFDGQAPPSVPLEENISFGTNVPSQAPELATNMESQGSGKTDAAQIPNHPTTPPRPKFGASESAQTANGLPRSLPPRSPGTNPMARSVSPPKPKSPKRAGGVSFVDDNASVGHTVASSTFGEDRIKAHKQTIMDPYGDKGEYTGIILRSTGMPHGYGEMVYHEDKRTYAGEWRHGRWHGFGRASFANGDTYEGEYRFDQRHGRGIYQWHDGRVFDGMFREDKRHGKGKFIWPDGAVYEGEFRNGQREGQGQYTFSDGGKYEGSWKDGRYSGYGVCSWEDGRCYKGEWLNGMAHGKGIETFADGTVRHDGLWREDEPVI